MKLFIYDKFWEALLKLNKDTQNKVTEFIKKFRQNSKSSAIHLEPIVTFKDKTLRTARIDQKYRAVLKEVDAGNVYFLLWVDNHDEAMAWAQNKLIQWNEHTDAFQVFTIDETIAPNIEKESSIDVLFMGKYGKEDLLKIGVPEVLMPSVLQIQDLSGLEQFEAYLPIDVFENLFYLLDGASLDALITEISEGRKQDDEQDSKNNARSFIELTDDEIFNEALSGSLQKWKYYLHPSQSVFVHGKFKGSIKLSGGAGTGKTVAALHRLKHLAEHNNSGLPILFTTYTKELSSNLVALANGLGINNNNYVIDNIDGIAFNLAKQFQLIKPTDKVFGLGASDKLIEDLWDEVIAENFVPYDEEFLRAEFEQVVLEQNVQSLDDYLKASRVGRGKSISRKQRVELWNIFDAFFKKKNERQVYYKEEIYNLVSTYLRDHQKYIYAHVIVDELQDFSNVELNFIRSLVAESANDLFLVGDPLQNIYNKKINFSRAGINIRGNRSKRLRINYRTTEEIKNLAISIVREEEFDNFDGETEDKKGYLSLFHGVKPEYHIFRTKDEELSFVAEEINKLLDDGFHYNDIVIAARIRSSVNDFRNHLHLIQLPYVDKDLLNTNNEGIRLTTFHGLKGLEFKHVFLVDVNERTLPMVTAKFEQMTPEEKSQSIKTEKALFYVACSRAIQRLMITGIGVKSKLMMI